MLTVTEPAKAMLEEMLDHARAPEGRAIRMIPDPKGFIIQIDEPRESDEKHPESGKTLLILDGRTAQLLENKTLSAKPSEKGMQLILTNAPE